MGNMCPAVRTQLKFSAPVLLFGVMGTFSAAVDDAPFTVDGDFPGGNIVVEGVDGDTVALGPDLRDTEGWWFYWAFRVRGGGGRTLTFRFSDRNPIGVRGPAVSIDAGATWTWLEDAANKEGQFSYAFPPDSEEVRFSFAPPYVESNLRSFLASYEGSPFLTQGKLCTSRGGRKVECLRVGAKDAAPRFGLLLTARHHACECMANYVLEGILAATLADSEDGAWFREHVAVLALPFMDKDGVEEGDQGKNRRPHDHNRDYGDASLYPEVRALKALVPEWSRGLTWAALDLHCPYIRGKHNEIIYAVGSADEEIWDQQCLFGEVLEEVNTGPLPYRASDNLPFGEAWNTAKNYAAGVSFGRWAGQQDGVRLATTLEIPYANAGGAAVTASSARAFGGSLAAAVRTYLAGLDNDE